MSRNNIENLVNIYKEWPEERLQEEVEALFDICFAMLEVMECDSIEQFPNPNVKIKISCEIMKDHKGKFYN
jgi:hypothetical protein